MDVFTKEKRSEIMSRVKGRGNVATELKLISLLKKNKIRGWRRNFPIFGKPDFVFPKQKVAIFVDGDFWHGHKTRGQIPKTNRDFWKQKIEANRRRDKVVNRTLKSQGWAVIRIWQSDLLKSKTLKKISSTLNKN